MVTVALSAMITLSNMVGVTRSSSFIRNANQNDSGFAWKTDMYPGASIVNTQKTKAVIGASEGYLYNLDEVSILTKPNAQNWSVITLTLIEGSSFNLPGKILVTATGYTENTNMGWKNPEKSTVGSDWGQAPSLIDCISADITLPVSSSKVNAWSLDSTGQRVSKMTITGTNKAIISIGSPYNTLWYEVEIK